MLTSCKPLSKKCQKYDHENFGLHSPVGFRTCAEVTAHRQDGMKVMQAVLAVCAGKHCGGSCRVVDVLAERHVVDLRRRCGKETVADGNDELAGRRTPDAGN